MKIRYLIPALALALVLFAGLLVAMTSGPVAAAPAAAPTPISVSQSAKDNSEVAFMADVVLTADGNSASANIAKWQLTDIQYNIDQTLADSVMNTTTLKLQFSNDGANWTDGATIATSNVADASVLTQQAVFGKFARINADVSNANPVTVSVYAILK